MTETNCRACFRICRGPCYDFCMCHHCWRGWVGLSWWRKVWYRFQYLWNDG